VDIKLGLLVRCRRLVAWRRFDGSLSADCVAHLDSLPAARSIKAIVRSWGSVIDGTSRWLSPSRFSTSRIKAIVRSCGSEIDGTFGG
jgi:hypothetical protein